LLPETLLQSIYSELYKSSAPPTTTALIEKITSIPIPASVPTSHPIISGLTSLPASLKDEIEKILKSINPKHLSSIYEKLPGAKPENMGGEKMIFAIVEQVHSVQEFAKILPVAAVREYLLLEKFHESVTKLKKSQLQEVLQKWIVCKKMKKQDLKEECTKLSISNVTSQRVANRIKKQFEKLYSQMPDEEGGNHEQQVDSVSIAQVIKKRSVETTPSSENNNNDSSEPPAKRKKKEEQLQHAYELFFEGENKVKCPVCNKNDIDLLQKAGRDGAHIIPESKGGACQAHNFVPSCRTCNNSCGTKNLLDYMGEISARRVILKRLVFKLYVTYESVSTLRTNQGQPRSMIEWVKNKYAPESVSQYEDNLTLTPKDWEDIITFIGK